MSGVSGALALHAPRRFAAHANGGGGATRPLPSDSAVPSLAPARLSSALDQIRCMLYQEPDVSDLFTRRDAQAIREWGRSTDAAS